MRRYIITGIILVLLFGVAGCSQPEADTPPAPTPTPEPVPTPETGGYVDVTPAEAKALIDSDPDLIVIDVSPAYDEGHLPGAVSYPLGDGTLEAVIPMLDKDATYLVYCHVNSVAIAGAQALIDAGFMKVYRLEGNYSAWVDAGYPIEM